MILFGKELPDLPGIDPELDPEEGKEYQVAIYLKTDEAKALGKTFRIDVNATINDAIVSETFMSLSKMVAVDAFFPGKDDIKELEGIKELVEELKSNKGFVIVNVALGLALQDIDQFNLLPLNKSLKSYAGLYQIGAISDCKVFIDPMMLYGDNRACAVSNNFYNFAEGSSELSLILDGMVPKTKITFKFNSKGAESKVFKVNNIQI